MKQRQGPRWGKEDSHAEAKLDLQPQTITLIQLITGQTNTFLTTLCKATHTHTHLLIDAWVSPVFLSLSSLSVLPWRKCVPLFAIAAASQSTWLQPPIWSQSHDAWAITLAEPSPSLATLCATSSSPSRHIKGSEIGHGCEWEMGKVTHGSVASHAMDPAGGVFLVCFSMILHS